MSSGMGNADDRFGPRRLHGGPAGPQKETPRGKEERQPGPEEEIAVEIPAELCEELSALAASNGFRSVEEFVLHLLRDETARRQLENSTSAYSPRELQLIRKLLQGTW